MCFRPVSPGSNSLLAHQHHDRSRAQHSTPAAPPVAVAMPATDKQPSALPTNGTSSTSTSTSTSSTHHGAGSGGTSADNTVAVHSFTGDCMCCAPPLVDRLEATVWDIVQRPLTDAATPDALIIETSGVADPRSLIAILERRFGACAGASGFLSCAGFECFVVFSSVWCARVLLTRTALL